MSLRVRTMRRRQNLDRTGPDRTGSDRIVHFGLRILRV